MEAPALTAVEARTFEHGKSMAHAMILAGAAQDNGCSCQAYQDWFTYRRWQAQGMQVQKGEHGVKLTTWVTFEREDSQGKVTVHKRPKGTTVFCRCQVAPVGQ